LVIIYGPLISISFRAFSIGVRYFLPPIDGSLNIQICLVYVTEIVYVITICLIKMSILAFYLQIFTTPQFRIQCYVIIGFCASTGIAFLIVTVFQCSPISFAFNKTQPGTCINFNAVTWTNAAFNILQDIIIIILPLGEVRKLQLDKKKKLGLYLMFGLGGM
jgi:hypothetical protein